MKCCSGPCVCVFAVFWTMVQIGLHLTLPLYSIRLRDCENLPDLPEYVYFYYFTYLYDKECGAHYLAPLFNATDNNFHMNKSQNDSDYLEIQIPVGGAAFTIMFPKASQAATRAFNIFLAYTIIDAIWVIASVALLMGTCLRIKEFWATVFYFPWVIMDMTSIILDIVAVILFGMDISKTDSISKWFQFIGVQNFADLEPLDAEIPSIVTMAPSIILTVFSSRFLIVPIINFILLFVVLSAGWSAYQNSYEEEGSKIVHNNSRPPQHQNHHPNSNHNFQTENDANSAAARIQRWQQYYGDVNRLHPNYYEDDLNYQQRRKQANDYEYQIPQVRREQANDYDYQIPQGRRDLPRNSQVGRQYQDYQGPNNLYYEQEPEMRRPRDNYVEQLRGELPWSYFQDRNVVNVPRGRNDYFEGTMPPVPVPDYTIRFNPKSKTRTNIY